MPTKSTKRHNITDIKGRTKKIACIGCAILNQEVENPGSIAQTKYFVAEQDYEIPIPGFVILASKKHIYSIDEFSEAEQWDFIKFLCRLRHGMRKALNVKYVYLIQEEDTTNSHFHVWMLPRYPWMKKQFGRKIESIRPIMEYARKNMKTKNNLRRVDTT